MVVLSETEAEKAAAKLPLPSFDNQEDELYCATEWAASRKRSLAYIVLGLSSNDLKSDWRKHRKRTLESRRFSFWARLTSAYWDTHRGAYVVHHPSGSGEGDTSQTA